MSTEVNRRDAFRLDDSMLLSVKKLSDSELENLIENFDAVRLQHCLKSHFMLQRENRKTSLLFIRKRDPDVAQFLNSLEDQLMLVASRLSSTTGDEQSMILHDVNMSSSSIRFSTTSDYKVGEQVQCLMTLATSDLQIFTLATVTRFEDASVSEGQNSVALQFTHLHSDDSEAIIRHMAKLQQIQLQQRRAD